MQWPPLSSDAYRFLRLLKFRCERAWDDDDAVCDEAVGRVMLLGDIHNNRLVFEAALGTAVDEGCDVLVQVGDFWLQDCTWWGFSPERAGLMHCAVHSPIPVVVVDGNHEVWPCLSEFRQRDDTAAAQMLGGPLHLGGSLWWAERGSVWTWGGARFGALGGAVSPDRWMAQVAAYRWEEETTTQGDLYRLLDNAADGLDVLISHDAPAGASGLVSGMAWAMPAALQREAGAARALIQAAVDATTPELVFHGHWHQQNRCQINVGATEVVGLAADGHAGSAAVLSISDLQTRYVHMPHRLTRQAGGSRSTVPAGSPSSA